MKGGPMGQLSVFLLAAWLILVGLTWATVITLSGIFLGWAAVVVGAVILIETFLYPRYLARNKTSQ